jgi:hypothetical protein
MAKDRAALGLGRRRWSGCDLDYLQYLVFRRYETIGKNGPWFDRDSAPAADPLAEVPSR